MLGVTARGACLEGIVLCFHYYSLAFLARFELLFLKEIHCCVYIRLGVVCSKNLIQKKHRFLCFFFLFFFFPFFPLHAVILETRIIKPTFNRMIPTIFSFKIHFASNSDHTLFLAAFNENNLPFS